MTADDDRKFGVLNFEEQIVHMERLDAMHEHMLQQRMLKFVDILLIAPYVALAVTPSIIHATLNPVLYISTTYAVAFKLGQEYPVNRPFLSIYLGQKVGSRCSVSSAVFIKTLLVSVVENTVEKPNDEVLPLSVTASEITDISVGQHSIINSDYTDDELIHAEDGTYVVNWSVPEDEVKPATEYCFLFDMSRVDPYDVPPVEMGLRRNLNRVRPAKAFNFAHTLGHYHTVKPTPFFSVRNSPEIFSAEYFVDRFGGKDLTRFLGGPLMSVQYFDLIYKRQIRRWNQNEFMRQVMLRARVVKVWFQDLIDGNHNRFDQSFFGGSRAAFYDTGFSAMEERRQARMRAIGLLFHANGRKALQVIGEALVQVSDEYYRAIKPAGKIFDFFMRVAQSLYDLYQNNLGQFTTSRNRLKTLTIELGNACGPSLSQEILDLCQAEYHTMIERHVKMDDGSTPKNPKVITDAIDIEMSKLILYEIKLVISKMGYLLLVRKTTGQRFSEAFLTMSTYDPDRVIQYAAALKLYGTKFIAMAKCFAIGDSHSECHGDYATLELNDSRNDEEIIVKKV